MVGTSLRLERRTAISPEKTSEVPRLASLASPRHRLPRACHQGRPRCRLGTAIASSASEFLSRLDDLGECGRGVRSAGIQDDQKFARRGLYARAQRPDRLVCRCRDDPRFHPFARMVPIIDGPREDDLHPCLPGQLLQHLPARRDVQLWRRCRARCQDDQTDTLHASQQPLFTGADLRNLSREGPEPRRFDSRESWEGDTRGKTQEIASDWPAHFLFSD